jgi:hypothetical protein
MPNRFITYGQAITCPKINSILYGDMQLHVPTAFAISMGHAVACPYKFMIVVQDAMNPIGKSHFPMLIRTFL